MGFERLLVVDLRINFWDIECLELRCFPFCASSVTWDTTWIVRDSAPVQIFQRGRVNHGRKPDSHEGTLAAIVWGQLFLAFCTRADCRDLQLLICESRGLCIVSITYVTWLIRRYQWNFRLKWVNSFSCYILFFRLFICFLSLFFSLRSIIWGILGLSSILWHPIVWPGPKDLVLCRFITFFWDGVGIIRFFWWGYAHGCQFRVLVD